MIDTYGIIISAKTHHERVNLTPFKPCYTIQTPALLARDESLQPSRRNGAGFVLSSEVEMSELLTSIEVAALLGRSVGFVQEHARAGDISGTRRLNPRNGHEMWVFDPAEIEAYILSRQQDAERLTIPDLVERLGCHINTVLRAIRTGQLKGTSRISKAHSKEWAFDPEEVQRFEAVYFAKKNVALRFWSMVDQSAGPDACWPWTGPRNEDGYGRFTAIPNKRMPASRYSYELHYGPLGDYLACHECDNPPCCNPKHLFRGTQADNMKDMNAKGRNGASRRKPRKPK